VSNNLIQFLEQKRDVFAFSRSIDAERFLIDTFGDAVGILPVPAKIFLVDELQPHSYGFAVMHSSALEDVDTRLGTWIEHELAARANTLPKQKADESLKTYIAAVIRLAQNAIHSSILADYHAVFWLVHSQQAARHFTNLPRKALSTSGNFGREQADILKYSLFSRWQSAIREALPQFTSRATGTATSAERSVRFVRLLLDNVLLLTEEFISPDLMELRTYVTGHSRREFATVRKWFEELKAAATSLLASDSLFRRSVALLGYSSESAPSVVMLVDRRFQQLVTDRIPARAAADQQYFEALSRRILEFIVLHNLRRGVTWMKTSPDGDNVSDDRSTNLIYSRAIRPMNFGRRGIVEPIVYRFGLVYDITSFTQTLGEVARGGKEGEQASYRQMLEFQRDLSEITRKHGLQFEKFLGDGAFYTSRRATRTIQASLEVQQFYSTMKERGFAFNKGMRIALNYGYYRLLPMQVAADGTEIMEFYGPGIVELSRLTTGKATKEIEDIQHLLLSHGYDQMDVYRFFAPLARGVDTTESSLQHREFYAYVNANGHLINEGIVVSIPFLQQLSTELIEDQQKMYRLRTSWASYLGFPATHEADTYVAIRLLGAVSLKGIGNVDVAEVVRVAHDQAEVTVLEETKPLVQLLQQERNRSTARMQEVADDVEQFGSADLVVCESHMHTDNGASILVGEWDPVSEEVRRPIRLDGDDADRYGLARPLTMASVESQSRAYQQLYRKLSRIDTLPSFSIQAIRDNTNFSGFIIGDIVEPL
jgi:hypothetical protein